MDEINHIELNAILFYADFLSLKAISQPVTDNCKYFFIHGYPINSAFIVDLEPEYDPENQYIMQAVQEFQAIRDKYDEDAAMSFIDDICSIKACGSVSAEQMLKCIHRYSTKQERKTALNVLKNLHFDSIKLDKEFLNGFDSNPYAQNVIEGTVKMIKKLGVQVVAEGVETREQADFLHRIGCDIAQGYFFSRPIKAETFEQMLPK